VVVIGEAGVVLSLDGLLEGKTLWVLFRHCLWHGFTASLTTAFADGRLRDAAARRGVSIIGIGTGDYHAIKAFRRMTGFPGSVYLDSSSELAAFKALGAQMHGAPESCCAIARHAAAGAVLGLARAARQPSLLAGVRHSNMAVQGGVLLLEGRQILFEAMFERIDQAFPLERLLAALS
jgi:hypothetical protein